MFLALIALDNHTRAWKLLSLLPQVGDNKTIDLCPFVFIKDHARCFE